MGDQLMVNRRYQQVRPRSEMMLLPQFLEICLAEDSPVRVIDEFVDALDLAALGFRHTDAYSGAGQPAFEPALLLKLYLYGNLHRVQSSRRLAAEARRNVEVKWLCQEAAPSYRTIAGFLKHNETALRAVNRQFADLCRDFPLICSSSVAHDGC